MSLSSVASVTRDWEEFAGAIGSNADQQYLSHSVFRYFGKLPPVLTGQILDRFAGPIQKAPTRVLDLMCGSGTTLVESQKRGFDSTGVDVNPIALLASRVKTRKYSDREILSLIELASSFASTLPAIVPGAHEWEHAVSSRIPEFPNRDRWFPKEVQYYLARWRAWIQEADVGESCRELALISWLGIVRQVSRASVRTGRIFYDSQKPGQDVTAAFLERLSRNCRVLAALPDSQFHPRVTVVEGDARSVELSQYLPFDFVLLHPPYFALYKYSSDVLRFELEWNRSHRKQIAAREIEDGFKTTRAELLHIYIDDLQKVLANAMKHTRGGGKIAVVVGNSTLSEVQLPVIPELLSRIERIGLKLEHIFERRINHAQVKYHRSKNAAIRSDNDFVLVMRCG